MTLLAHCLPMWLVGFGFWAAFCALMLYVAWLVDEHHKDKKRKDDDAEPPTDSR